MLLTACSSAALFGWAGVARHDWTAPETTRMGGTRGNLLAQVLAYCSSPPFFTWRSLLLVESTGARDSTVRNTSKLPKPAFEWRAMARRRRGASRGHGSSTETLAKWRPSSVRKWTIGLAPVSSFSADTKICRGDDDKYAKDESTSNRTAAQTTLCAE
jgi:hypothetical protein